ncbi:enoyl-CoA hydratase/isomerase family protein [Leptospira sp. GIMC2001]|uniref:enoyl-CoA hydratase/isomerase family protein n=1 Tax=Leptospira sp. GIMC2001 TaxID=1513297 RepID=UPI00234AAEB2|nr:enoyl-CoA hydratase/isomerase family protein [Leptospira sp. GIMC2001]WCL50001.1 enoyl-CoA hydratase/isomerase family protein [Leptospira sp. GIMC2001]
MPNSTKLEIIQHNQGRLIEVKMNFNSKNTYDLEGLQLILDTLHKIKSMESIRAMILSSNQESYFSNGLEPTLFLDATHKEVHQAVSLLMDASQAFYFFPYPTLSLIQGHCMAAGAVFAIFSDYRFMVDKAARIGFPEVAIGLNFPSFPAKVLSHIVGHNHARDLLYSGKLWKADQALASGLIDEIYSKDTIRTKALEFSTKLSNLPLGSARGIKKSLLDFHRHGIEQLIEWDTNALVETILSRDGQEGFRSILESRKPQF